MTLVESIPLPASRGSYRNPEREEAVSQFICIRDKLHCSSTLAPVTAHCTWAKKGMERDNFGL